MVVWKSLPKHSFQVWGRDSRDSCYGLCRFGDCLFRGEISRRRFVAFFVVGYRVDVGQLLFGEIVKGVVKVLLDMGGFRFFNLSKVNQKAGATYSGLH